MRSITRAAAVAALSASAWLATGQAQAQTVTLHFDDLASTVYASNFTYEGYVFSPSHNVAVVAAGAPPQFAASAFLGLSASSTLSPPNPAFLGTADSLLYVTRADGLPFTLQSLTGVGAQWGVVSSNGGAAGFAGSGPVNFSGSEWAGLQWLQFSAGNGDFRGFDNLVLTAVPEPSTALLLAMGAIALAARRRQQRQG